MGWEGTNPAEWARRAKAQIRAVRNESIEALAKEMSTGVNLGGDVPYDRGDLVQSLTLQSGSMPNEAAPGTRFQSAPDLTVPASAPVGETIYLGYRVNYARRQNYGFQGTDALGRAYNQAGRLFVEKAAAKWQQIVAKVTLSVRNRVK